MIDIENVGGIKLSIVLAGSDFRLLEGFLLFCNNIKSESSQTNVEMTTKLTMVDLVKGLQEDLLE
jgi:hypothetical protein